MTVKLAVAVAVKATDGISAPLKRMTDRMNRSFAPLRRLNERMKQLGRAAKLPELARRFRDLRGHIVNVGSAVRTVTLRMTAMAAAGAFAVARLITGYTSLGDRIGKTSKRLGGVSVEWLQRLEFAADRSGIPLRTMEQSVLTLQQRFGDLQRGSKEMRDVFRLLNIETRDASGRYLELEQLFPRVADALAGMRNSALRTSLAVKLFEKEGLRMVQLLGEGSSGMEELMRRADQLGFVMGAEAIAKTEQFQDTLTDLRYTLIGLRNRLVVEFLPAIQEKLGQLLEWLSSDEAKKKIKELGIRIEEAFSNAEGILKRLKAGLRAIEEAMRPLVLIGKKLQDRFGAANVAVAAFVLFVGGPLIGAVSNLLRGVVSLGVGLGKTIALILRGTGAMGALSVASGKLAGVLKRLGAGALAGFTAGLRSLVVFLSTKAVGAIRLLWTVLRFHPIGRVIALIGALIAAGVALWKNWEKVADFFEGIWERIKNAFGGGIDWIRGKLAVLGKIVPKGLRERLGFSVDVGPVSPQAELPTGGQRAVQILREERVRRQEAKLKVEIAGLRPGDRVRQDSPSGFPMDTDLGYIMANP